jgi:DNA-binding LacI/PurR family transcriptional regulator
VIATSDLIADGAACAWREADPIEPAPLMIGFDASPMNEWLVSALISIRIPYDAFSHAIVVALDGPDKHAQIVLPHPIIERGMQALLARK